MAVFGLAYCILRASLPALDGRLQGTGLAAPVRIERDRLGVPTIEAATRTDLAYATGFVHGQDRFFQMDLSRRVAAGELAELFGAVALPHDRRTRLFRFRQVAAAVLAAAAPEERALADAYARGVNAGLAALGSRPWEYWLLRAKPVPWRPADSILVTYAMWWDLQASGLEHEILLREINERLGGPLCGARWKCALEFWYPGRTSWDAPADLAPEDVAAAFRPPPVPGPEVLDLRGTAAARARAPSGTLPAGTFAGTERSAVGSNNWAVAGSLTETGAALVANDMHLTQRVPIVWYRARLKVRAPGAQPTLDATGVTLPGAPLLVAGSNGWIAWGFTNSYGNWMSVEAAPCAQPLAIEHEAIGVKGAAPVRLEIKTGAAGVLVRSDGVRCWFASWLALNPAATNLKLMGLERAHSVADALALAAEIGIPHQNAVIGDREGHIAWTIFGRVPQDTGSGRSLLQPVWTTAGSHPRLLDPPWGRIWTANARVTSAAREEALLGGDEAVLGAEYNLGARAGQIRKDLLALERPIVSTDLLRIQLDDRALFLARWRDLVLKVLDEAQLRGHPERAEFRRLVAEWNARASPDSVGYRLVRNFRDHVRDHVWEMLLQGLRIDPPPDGEVPAQFEEPLWRLVSEQPQHLLSSAFSGWPAFLLAQVDASSEELRLSCGELRRCSWSYGRAVRIRHPLSGAIPWAASLLDMPPLDLPGDNHMPRVQVGEEGASERFAVSPGHEADGYFHMPGGQSGHPLSPYYRAGFLAWARGEPLPFLPGPVQHTLTLAPPPNP